MCASLVCSKQSFKSGVGQGLYRIVPSLCGCFSIWLEGSGIRENAADAVGAVAIAPACASEPHSGAVDKGASSILGISERASCKTN